MKKSTAKQSAAFDTCLLLRKHKLLDDHFNSIYHRRLPAMRNAKLAITSKQTNQYDMMSKPSFWRNRTPPATLYAMVISLIPSNPLMRKHGSLVLLTRERLPGIPNFSIFLEEDVETTIHSVPMENGLVPSTDELDFLTIFTLRVFRDVFHKIYDRETEKMPYWLAPAATDVVFEGNTDAHSTIDWKTLSFIRENEEIQWSSDKAPDFLNNRFVFDGWDGRYRYFTLEVEESLRASDPPPSYVPRRRHMGNIVDYCLSLSKNSRAKFFATCDWSQPVVRAELVRLRRNLLDKMSDSGKEIETRLFICPQPLKISAVSYRSCNYLKT